ncbi:MAG: 3'-phosphoadenosine 5'-phosphosulfate sulfotransferase (PAPS reductase)/FAD synthetase [Verrucomicrobiae bacterium]|nr:3'-phosphoadenosine 5'-phosphosulfate sulfotransferase (PAPS reductase)/FAD synthetase [Verrucomicrobiae bacterium]
MNIVSFSGGKDSTAMLLMMLEKGIHVDRVICVDTTKEFPAMYRHIEKVQAMIEPLKVEVVKIDFDYWFGEHIKTKGKKKGEKGYGFPDFRNRWCTALKQESYGKTAASMRYDPRKRGGISTISKEVVEYHGIAFDEKHRAENNKKRNIKYPLIEWEITEKQALEYCYSRGLDWEGLYEKFHRVSCWCCPLSRIGELRVLYNDFPELWKELVEMDKKSFRRFRSDYSVSDLTKRFVNENL